MAFEDHGIPLESIKVINLTEYKRTSDPKLIKILQDYRIRKCTDRYIADF